MKYEQPRMTSTHKLRHVSVCFVADSDEEAMALVPDIYGPELRDTSLVGSPATIRQRVAALESLGVQEVILDLPSATDLTVLYRFAKEFIA